MKVTLENIEDTVLPLVVRPNRYLGNFEGARVKDPGGARARVVLAFPDCYDLGMSHLGLKILYRIINDRDDSLAELVFAPWPDMEEKMRAHGLPLFTLETRTPVSRFDILGFSLQYELHYTTVLNMLDLAGIPLYSRDRGEDHPLVIAGGPCAFSPEPMAPFMDAFLIGDGEEAIVEVLEAAASWRRRGRSREGVLRALAAVGGVYVPSLYETARNATGHLVPLPAGSAPSRITPARISNLASAKTRPAHIVPLTEVTHSRLSVEVMRGCPRTCRFCMPGSIYRPVRRKAEEDVLGELRDGMAEGGWEEVSLLSLSTSDYKGISELVGDVSKMFLGRGVNVSLPSIRPGTLPPRLARSLTFVRKSGLTFAPEAGSDRLRRVIDKRIAEKEMIESVDVAAAAGWKAVKLYFMVGLPTETDDDVRAIGRLVLELRKAARLGGRKMGLKVSVAGFVPKAHTPFQWEPQLEMQALESRIALLKRVLRPHGVRLRWRDVETTFLEGLLSRGDRRLADVIHAAWRRGCKFDGWSDMLNFESWRRALVDAGVDPSSYLGPRDVADPLPWSHIGVGATERLLRERERAAAAAAAGEDEKSRDAGKSYPFFGGAHRSEGAWGRADRAVEGPVGAPDPRTEQRRRPADRGADGGEAKTRSARSESSAGVEERDGFSRFSPVGLYGRAKKRSRSPGSVTGTSYRLQFEKAERVRFISHLDVVRAFDRAIRRAALPIAFSKGYSKHPKLAFGPPLPLGMTSVAEYLDVEFSSPQSGGFREAVNECLPRGLRVARCEPHGSARPASLMSAVTHADYAIRAPEAAMEGGAFGSPRGAVADVFRSGEMRLSEGAAAQAGARDGSWREVVRNGRVSWGAGGPELLLTVRLNVKNAPKIREVAAELLSELELDSRLLRVERKALWVERKRGLVSPFNALCEAPPEVAVRPPGEPGVSGRI